MPRDASLQTPRTIVFLGAPGSGKGTQSSWLSTRLGIPRLAMGELLRLEARRRTPAGVRLATVLNSGSLVNDDLVCEVVAAKLRSEIPARGIILDGFPRTVRQAAFLDEILAELGLGRPAVIHLQVSESGLLRRLGSRRHCAACGSVYNLVSRPSARGARCELDGELLAERDDDRKEVIVRRLQEFETSSAPLIDYYRNGELHNLDGDRPLDVVASELLKVAAREELCIAA